MTCRPPVKACGSPLVAMLTLATALVARASWAVPAAAPGLSCPGPRALVQERFTSADCLDCWQRPSAPATTAGWVLDWISPTTPEAAMSAAAPIESKERAQRSGVTPPVAQQALVAHSALRSGNGLQLSVQSGPAWSGYIGVQLHVGGRVPRNATGWLALVEAIPAGEEGSTVRRELVRAVTGPLPLAAVRSAHRVDHLLALRWPETARPERLEARVWLEGESGRIIAMASERCPRR